MIRLDRHVNAQFAVAADLNPGDNFGPVSRNHEDTGQNVLFGDGHVSWEKSPLLDLPAAGFANNSIYRNRNNQVIASPVDKGDSVLLPAQP